MAFQLGRGSVVKMGNRLNPEQRVTDLSALAGQDFDVVVVGGGVTGAGIALDAAARGLRTAIIEAQDWAAGTSSASSGLVHGGLRYLYNLDIRLVAEMITERGLLLNTLAPHLVRPQTFLWPLHRRILERAGWGAGTSLYDTLGAICGGRCLPAQRQRSRAGTIARFPDVDPDALVGAIEFHEGFVDDARLVITLIRTALEYGARAVSRVQVTRINRSAGGPVTGLTARDLETGEQVQVRARGIINATGIWTEQTAALAQVASGLRVLAAKGIHLLVPRERIDAAVGIFYRTGTEALYLVPWQHRWVIGTTDTAWHEPLQYPVPTRTDIDNLLRRANLLLKQPLTRNDLCGSFAGLRPLLQPHRGSDVCTSRISRRHTVRTLAPGLVAVAGGKLTTYRRMAADAVDALLGRQRTAASPSVTAQTPLLGAQGLEAMTNQSQRIGGIYGWSRTMMAHLLECYGSELPDLLELVDDSATLAAPLGRAPHHLRVEVARACTAEGALHLEDILVRRIRLNREHRDRGLSAMDEVCAIAAPLLGWDAARIRREKASYQARVAAEQAAQAEPTDRAAVAIRRKAADAVPTVLG